MNVDWGSGHTCGYRDPAFPALASVLSPPDAVGPPTAVYYYPARTLQAVHPTRDGTLVVTEAVPQSSTPPDPGPADLWHDGLRAVRRTLPHDPGLPALAGVARSSGLAPEQLGDALLAYLPGRRAVLRVGDLVVKVGDPTTTRRNHDRQRALWSDPARGFAMSRPRSVDAERGVRAEDLVDGVPLTRALAGRPVPGLASELADSLAALHRLPPPAHPLSDHSAATALVRWRRKTVRTVARALPDLAPRAARVVDGLAARGLPDPAAGVVHGDFHAANVMVTPSGPVLLDLDEIGLGDPELDVAVMTGRLLLVASVAPADSASSAAADLATAFARAYDARADRPLRPDVFAWYLAGTLVGRQVKTSIRHLAPGLPLLASRLLDLAESVLDGPDAAPHDLLGRLAGNLLSPRADTRGCAEAPTAGQGASAGPRKSLTVI